MNATQRVSRSRGARFASRCAIGLAILLVVFALVLVADISVLDEPFLAEGPPRIDGYFVLRSLLVLALAFFVVSDVYRSRDAGSKFETGWHASPAGTVAGCIVIVLSFAAATLLVVNPRLYDLLALEDSVVEWTSAAALFFGAALLLVLALVLAFRGKGQRNGLMLTLLLAGILFLIGMEEVSWLQRVADVPTPAWYSELNWQNEINLHNVYTSETENAYYMGAFMFLVAFPFIVDAAPRWQLLERVEVFVPNRFIVVMGAISAFAWGMWNIAWIQFGTFASVFILICYARAADRHARHAERTMFVMAALVLLAVQVVLLSRGATQVRAWSDTEYREMFIAIALAAMSVQVTWRLLFAHKRPGGAAGRT